VHTWPKRRYIPKKSQNIINHRINIITPSIFSPFFEKTVLYQSQRVCLFYAKASPSGIPFYSVREY
jgi:hypothetical protein